MARPITRPATIRSCVLEVVEREQPCRAEEVIEALDGRCTADQIYAALSHMCRGDSARLTRTGLGYYEVLDAAAIARRLAENDDAPAPLDSLLELADELAHAPPVDLTIQNAEEKVATCELLEKLLTPHLAERIALIRADLARIANL